jgi:hypothetical protein
MNESGGGFGAEDSLEAGAGELDSDVVLAGLMGVGYVHDAAISGEIFFGLLHAGGAARGVAGERNVDLEIRADGYVEASEEGGSIAAEIFAGGFLLEGYASCVTATDL